MMKMSLYRHKTGLYSHKYVSLIWETMLNAILIPKYSRITPLPPIPSIWF